MWHRQLWVVFGLLGVLFFLPACQSDSNTANVQSGNNSIDNFWDKWSFWPLPIITSRVPIGLKFGEMPTLALNPDDPQVTSWVIKGASKRILDASNHLMTSVTATELNAAVGGPAGYPLVQLFNVNNDTTVLFTSIYNENLQFQVKVALSDAALGAPAQTYSITFLNDTTNPVFGVWGPNDLSYIRTAMGSNYQQQANITLPPSDHLQALGIVDYDTAGWLPLGQSGSAITPFTGNYQGMGFSINNLRINRPNAQGQGLFGYNSGNIRYFNITGSSIISQGSAGSVAGYMNAGEITNITSAVSIYSSVGSNMGGLVGQLLGGSMSFSSSSGDISGAGGSLGGLVGNTLGGTVMKSFASGKVASTGGDKVGGLVGWQHMGTITQVYATGAVSNQTGSDTGGLVGFLEDNLSQCYATGKIESNYYNVGGLVGRQGGGTLSQCYAANIVTGYRYVGGLLGQFFDGSLNQLYTLGYVSGDLAYTGGAIGYASSNNSIHSVYYQQQNGITQGTYNILDTSGVIMAIPTHPSQANFAGFSWGSNPNTNQIWTWDGVHWPILSSSWAAGWSTTNQTLVDLP